MADQSVPRPGSPVRGSSTGRPVMAALDLLGRRWTLRVVWELHRAPAGFRELQRRCDRMSSSVLTTRLAELADVALVEEGADGYRLTRLGRELVESLLPLDTWARRWEKSLRR
ncbi:helix-turn-helix domain-containing protein [Amycolatopsis sp. NPDC006125]|uniref:winged helix-turn-helix transcriptional regulator n=1 Tax=Amycolatopsis sp. NPDC006125 TaxID=3156730 RepID=UPI0033A24039